MNHKKLFVKFARYEIRSGGPDPQMKIIASICEGYNQRQRLLLAGLYAIIYDVSSAEFVWQHMLKGVTPQKIVDKHWDGLIIRTERRCVRTKENFIECLENYFRWVRDYKIEKAAEYSSMKERYDYMWDQVGSIPFIGRYASIKLLRAIRNCLRFAIVEYDIRAKDGHSPRAALGLLYPDKADMLNNPKSRIKDVDRVAKKALVYVRDNNLNIGYYELQTLLCEYKETLRGNRFYPGRSHDEVLENHGKKDKYRDRAAKTLTFHARKKLFPKVHLGELSGWKTIRRELQSTLKEHNYIWSDLVYDYHATRDLANPVKRR